MNVLNGKRLAAIFLSFVGIFTLFVLVGSIRNYIWIAAILPFALFTLSLFLFQKPRTVTARKIILSVLMLLSVCGAILSGVFFVEKTENTANFYIGTAHTATAYVTDIHYEEPYGASYEVRLTELDGEKTDLGAILALPSSASLSIYDTITFEGVYDSMEEEFSLYRKADGIWLTVSAQSIEKIGRTEKPFASFFENIRLHIRRNFQNSLSSSAAGFATALLTGERDDLDGNIRLAFTRCGISHLLAVSGLHLAVIIGGADFILRMLTVPKKKKNLLLIVFTVFFSCVCGLSASILRAATMLSLYYLTDIFGENNDSLTALSFSAFMILLCHPRSVYDVGFWLSVLSTFGILCVMPALRFSFISKLPRVCRKPLRFLLSSLCMTFSATFFTLPVVYLTFGGISLISPFLNLIFIPLIQIILYLLVFFTLCAWIPFLAPLLTGVSEWLITFTVALAESFSDMKGIYISLRYPFVSCILIALIFGVTIVLFLKKVRPIWLFAVFLGFTLTFGMAFAVYQNMHRDTAYVYLRSDGKSDMIGIVSGRDAVLVDITTGGAAMPTAAYKDLADFYFCEIDAYILTHYHSYHANTLRKISENIKIHRLLLPEPLTENDYRYSEQIETALGDHIQIEYYQSCEEKIGNLTLSLPERQFLSRSEHPVICFSTVFGENGQSFSYLSSGATEIVEPFENTVILGSHGPKEKHIFAPSLFQNTQYLIFTDSQTASLTELDRIPAEIFYAEEYGGYFRILFDTGD